MGVLPVLPVYDPQATNGHANAISTSLLEQVDVAKEYATLCHLSYRGLLLDAPFISSACGRVLVLLAPLFGHEL